MTSFSLIQSVNEADDKGFLSQIRDKVFGSSEKKPAQSAPAAEPAEKSPDVSKTVPLLSQYADSIRQPGNGNIRYVLRMSVTDLGSLYLVSGGGAKFVSELSDEQVLGVANSPFRGEDAGTEEIEALKPGYTFKDLITPVNPVHDASVLLNIPQSLSDELTTAKMDANAARAALTKMMNHRFYVMAISNSKGGKIQKSVDKAWKDLHELSIALNPDLVVSYPDREKLARIHEEWADAAQVANEVREKQKARLERGRAVKASQKKAEQEKTDNVKDAEGKLAQAALDSKKTSDKAPSPDQVKGAYELLRNIAASDPRAPISKVMKQLKDQLGTGQ